MRRLYILLLMTISSISLFAQSDEEILKSLPEFVKGSNYGTEFWLTVPPALLDDNGLSDYLKLFLVSPWDATVKITVNAKGYNHTIKLAANTPDVVSILPEIAQPYIKSPFAPVTESIVFRNAAIRVTSDEPITLFAVVRYRQSSEGTLVLPLSALGNEYQIASFGDASQYYPTYNSFPSLAGVVAPFDETQVTFEMGGNANSVSSDGLRPGEKISKTLNSGDVWMFSSMGRGSDLTGSKITSNLPVAVLSANQCANIPIEVKQCGYIFEQIMPTRFWADNYMISKIPGRKYSPIVRIFASQTNTDITVNGIPAAKISKAGGIIGEGYVELRPDSDFRTGKGDNIKSNKPIAVVFYNSGVTEDGLPLPQGAPFMSIAGADVHAQKHVRFVLPGLPNDSKFGTNYLTLITETETEGLIPDDMYLSYFDGMQFQNLRVKDLNTVIKGDFHDDGKKPKMQITVKLPDYGTFEVKSTKHNFLAYLIGNNEKESYGYPAGLKLASGTFPEDTLAPEVKWSINCEGLIEGKTIDLPKNASIRSNLAGVIYYSNLSKNIIKGDFDRIIPGQTPEMSWKLRVENINKDAVAVLSFWDQSLNTKDVVIRYHAPKISIEPRYAFFGSMKAGESNTRAFSIANYSDSVFVVKSIVLKHGNKGFSLSDIPQLPLTLNAGENRTLEVAFQALENGILIDSLGFIGNCGQVYLSHLEAVVGNPVIEVPDISFGDVTMGLTKPLVSYIMNTGVSDLTVYKYTVSDEPAFEVEISHDFSDSPLIIAPNGKYPFTVHFRPTVEKTYTGQILFSSDANSKDSICFILNSRGMKPGLVAESYDWGRRRIHRFDFPAGPYVVDNDAGGMKIRNTGDAPITVAKMEQSEELNSESFEFNRLQFNNLTIAEFREYIFDVKFRPEILGKHKLTLAFTDSFGNETKSELTGYGVAPKIRSTIVNFDTVPVRNYSAPKNIKMKVENLGINEWEFADTLTIYGLSYDKDEISDIKGAYGKKGFYIDASAVNLPIKLAPGDFIIVDAYFVPDNEGLSSAELRIMSDAVEQATFALVGFGMSKDIAVQGGTGRACVNSSATITASIRNNGTTGVTLGPLKFRTPVPEFSFADVSDINGFELHPGETRFVEIIYTPTSNNNSFAEVIFADMNDPENSKAAKLTGEVILYKSDVKISPIEQSVGIGSEFTLKANFSSQPDFIDANLKELFIRITYDPSVLKPAESFIVASDLLKGRFESSNAKSTRGTHEFSIKALGNYTLHGSGELITMTFDAYYPNSSLKHSLVNLEVFPVNNSCADIKPASAKINVKPACADDIRQIEFAGTKYKFARISPNPVTSDLLTVNFAIGIESRTTITLTNLSGEVIDVPLDLELSKGEYEMNINLNGIASGIYYVEIQSGPFKDWQTIVISR